MSEITAWQDAGLPFTLEYARPAFERIRQQAAEGLIALPRVGMGIGGLLLGERTATGIRVTAAVELPCSHTLGPTFQLTPDEIRQAVELSKSASGTRAVVGIYCTRTRGALAVGGPDHELFDVLCPEPWQIVFALRPAAGEITRACVFFRDGGELKQGATGELWEWRPVETNEPEAETAAPAAPPKVLAVPPSVPVVIPMPAPPVAAAAAGASVEAAAMPTIIQMPPRPAPAAPAPQQEVATPAIAVEGASPAPKRVAVHPQFVIDAPAPQAPPASPWFAQADTHPSNKTSTRLLMLGSGLIVLVVSLALFATKDAWLPRPPISLGCTDNNGILEIHWNAQAARGLDHGALRINDGGGTQIDTVTLDPLTLLSGTFLYKRKTDRVTVTLDLGDVRDRTAYPPDPDGTAGSTSPSPVPAATLPDAAPAGGISAFGNGPAGTPPAPAAPPASTRPPQTPLLPAVPATQ